MKRFLIILIFAIFTMWWISQAENYTIEQQEAYNYAYSQKITTISPIEKAKLNDPLTRVAMAKMISNFAINVLWLKPDTSKDCSFSDVSRTLDSNYNHGVTQACQLWLMWMWNNWKKSDKFSPYIIVTRAQFATAFSRALSQANWKIVEDGNPYYSTHLQYLNSKWIIRNVNSPSADSHEKRWNVMIMMMRASKAKSNNNSNITNVNKNIAYDESKWNSEYYYKNLDITAKIWLDWKTEVLENFTAYFNVDKHWIIRGIPLSDSILWKDNNIDISDINVKWRTFTTYTEWWNIYIKIWDTNKTVRWTQIYPISYKIDWLIRDFSWYSELYWNLVGYDFDTSIDNVRAEIRLPKTYTWFTKEDFIITTTDWLTKSTDDFQWTINRSKWNKIEITYDKWLSAYEWISLVVKFPSDYFKLNSD